MESKRLETRLGPLAWQTSGHGPTLVLFAGALANHDLWREVVGALEDRYRCITIDLPLGAHPWPLAAGADRSATASPASPRVDWTTSGLNRSSGRYVAIGEWPTISSPPSPVAARNSSSTPPRRSRGSTGRFC